MQKPEQIEIRPYQRSDYSRVKDILVQGGLFYESVDSAERLDHVIKKDPESILIAVTEEKTVGTVSINDGRIPLIFRLAVDVQYRRHGVGTELMREAERRLKFRGWKDVHLLVDKEDKNLQEFYKKLGYDNGTVYQRMYKEF